MSTNNARRTRSTQIITSNQGVARTVGKILPAAPDVLRRGQIGEDLSAIAADCRRYVHLVVGECLALGDAVDQARAEAAEILTLALE